MSWYGDNKKLTEQGDCVQLSDHKEADRFIKQPSMKTIHMLDVLTPGASSQYVVMSFRGQHKSCKNLKIFLTFDFPPEANLEAE